MYTIFVNIFLFHYFRQYVSFSLFFFIIFVNMLLFHYSFSLFSSICFFFTVLFTIVCCVLFNNKKQYFLKIIILQACLILLLYQLQFRESWREEVKISRNVSIRSKMKSCSPFISSKIAFWAKKKKYAKRIARVIDEIIFINEQIYISFSVFPFTWKRIVKNQNWNYSALNRILE